MFNLSRIRRYLTQDTCKIVVQALVISHLDYTNICFAGLPKKDIDCLQHVQNIAAKVIMQAGHLDNPKDCMHELHWLPIPQRIQFNVLTLVHNAMIGKAPLYIMDLF